MMVDSDLRLAGQERMLVDAGLITIDLRRADQDGVLVDVGPKTIKLQSSKTRLMDLSAERILVTGGSGFLGSHLVEMLRERGADSLFAPRHIDYDLAQQEAARQILADTRPDIVIHLAAEVGGVGAHLVNPGRFFYANLAMGPHLIEESRSLKVRKFVQVGTVRTHPKLTPIPSREDDLWSGYPEEVNAPYGVAEKSLLVMLRAHHQQYAFNGIHLLPTSLFVLRDNFDLESSYVIPALIRKFVATRDAASPHVEVWGTGPPTREFLHVKARARAIILVAESYNPPEPINVGAGEEISSRELAEMIAKLTGYEGSTRWDTTKPDGQPWRVLETSRVKEAFGFEPQMPLGEGLRKNNHLVARVTTPLRASVPHPPPKAPILGIPISLASYDEVLALIDARPQNQATTVAFCNVHSVMTARRNPQIASNLLRFDVVTPDGMPLVWALRATAHTAQNRVAGPELMKRALRYGVERRWKHFFYGSTQETLGKLRSSAESLAPGVGIVGAYSPPFRTPTDQEVGDAISRIREAGADVVWVGLGMPKQEVWIDQVRDRLPGVALLGVGAAFDILAGNVRRAPQWMQDLGLEWLYRLVQEPQRLWRRYVFNNPAYLVLLIDQIIRQRLSRRHTSHQAEG